MQVQHIGSGVCQLLRRELHGAPVGRLLLFGQFDPEQFLAEVLEAVLVGEGADELGGDLGALNRADGDVQVVLQDGYVEAGEVHELEGRLVAHETLEVWTVEAAAAAFGWDKLDDVNVAVAVRHLHEAKAVSDRIEAHCFGVYGNDGTQGQAFGQVIAVEVDGAVGHELSNAHFGAQEKTRTSTTLRPQVPETCASTNSATRATVSPRRLQGAVREARCRPR